MTEALHVKVRRLETCNEVLAVAVTILLTFNGALIVTGRLPLSRHLGPMLHRHPWRVLGVNAYLLAHFWGIRWLRWLDPLSWLARILEWVVGIRRTT